MNNSEFGSSIDKVLAVPCNRRTAIRKIGIGLIAAFGLPIGLGALACGEVSEKIPSVDGEYNNFRATEQALPKGDGPDEPGTKPTVPNEPGYDPELWRP